MGHTVLNYFFEGERFNSLLLGFSSVAYVFHYLYVLAQRDISISQSKGSTSGIPQYIMQIVNSCVFGCAPNDIHHHCGWIVQETLLWFVW
ncbi:transmembrane protein, putative [Medicago truncatula]|uniref:Transmembrane protein, putative n=1 Tax=Medicago truncatula TaxID=3880 RepID=G7ILS9_MEDTR|nr:transmembrane protein, putative [Medicago truncatula]